MPGPRIEDTDLVLTATSVDHAPAEAQGEALPAGTPVGRYQVLGRIGVGGMGEVYAAYDPELDRRVAVKLLHAHLQRKGSEQTSRLQREAMAMAKLTHPNVVTVYDVGELGGRIFVAMEFVQGMTLGEWVRSKRPSWREVLDRYVLAGRGLAAAHAAGLVHRDFKPENVMLGDDGAVRVMDFGLARASAVQASPDAVREALLNLQDGPIPTGVDEVRDTPVSPEALATPLTEVGAVVGTPAYMAPEQHLGLGADARSDQFSFCVSLFQGLYGIRPFAGETAAALAFNVSQGKIRAAPAGTGVPGWVRKIVVRGLSVDPQERWPDMGQLLDALGRDPAVRRRRFAAVLLIAGGGAAAAAAVTSSADQVVCSGAQALAETWNDAHRARVTAAMSGTGLAYAELAARRATAGLDENREALSSTWDRACTTESRASPLAAARMVCLHRRRAALSAAVEVLASADAGVVERVDRVLSDLPSAARCLDVDYLEAQVKPPDDPEVERRVAELREDTARAKALRQGGKLKEAEELIGSLLGEAESLGYPPLLAEARYLQGAVRSSLGKPREAVEMLSRAYEEAVAVDDTETAANAALMLAFTTGASLAQKDAGLAWGTVAKALARRSEPGGTLEARVRHALGAVHSNAGENEAAEEQYRSALEIYEGLYGADDPQVSRILVNLGNVLKDAGRIEECRDVYRRALEIDLESHGEKHPNVALIYNNLSGIERDLGNGDEARKMLETALEIRREVLGPEHPHVGSTLTNLGGELDAEGEHEEALELHRQARAIYEKAYGKTHPNVAAAVTNMGAVLASMGKHEEALARHREARDIWEESLGKRHPLLAHALTSEGNELLELGRADEARDPLERALEIRTSQPVDAVDLANTRLALARVLVATRGDRRRAAELARQARDAYRERGKGSAEALEETESWMTEVGFEVIPTSGTAG